MSRFAEACITVNGKVLSEGQSMAVRVAITNFLMELRDEEVLTSLGIIGIAYHERLSEVIQIIMEDA